jgi:tetratricopeptide (TPR) repeat protein
MKSNKFSPKDFLKQRRPERFSDSAYNKVTELDRSLLEYHLDSLTTRSQETDFERFARRLAEYEICPNLLPQTGPTGGGDSKVDSETYPVADNLALAWYSGIGREASQERWAFAFSAKKDWRSKVNSDIAKIPATQREYAKAFFITNQAVPDRKRAEVEDSLRKKHEIDVRILDRTWILDKVFGNCRENLAIEELGITGLSRTILKKGAVDVSREDHLAEVEKRIENALRNGQKDFTLVDDSLEAADLARQLELPRIDIEGRYHRTNRLAQKFGTLRQKVECEYQWAWTLYWWLEDFHEFGNQYIVLEKLIKGSRNVYDLGQLFTLWQVLFPLSKSKVIEADIDSHTDLLITELSRLSKEIDRPSTSLEAETILIQVEMMRCLSERNPLDESLRKMCRVVQRSEGLIGYPLGQLVASLTEIGEFLEKYEAYDELFETVVNVTSKRKGEVQAAQLLLKRGQEQLSQDQAIKAIATLGRALSLLYKHETSREIVLALYLCAIGYEQAGLLWASRGTLISALSISVNEYWSYGDITPQQMRCSWKLKWLEIRLGRLPQLLIWHELSSISRYILIQKDLQSETEIEGEDSFDFLLAKFIFCIDFSEIHILQTFPDTLDQLGLELSADALLYVLGYEERFAETASMLQKKPEEAALSIRNLESDQSLADKLTIYAEGIVNLHSHILGCHITVSTSINSPSLEVAESFLAAFESFLATSFARNAIAHEPELSVEVRVMEEKEDLLSSFIEERSGRPHLVINCQDFNPHNISVDKQKEFRELLILVVFEAFTQVIIFKDFENDLEALFRDEKAIERAINFTGSVGTQANILGYSPKTSLASWMSEKATKYPLIRTENWMPKIIEKKEDEQVNNSLRLGELGSETPNKLSNFNQTTHDQMEVISLIRERLWKRAGWSGVSFMMYEGADSPPILGLIFVDKDAGAEIFKHWQEEIGKVDRQEKLRIVVVRGIDQAYPHAYNVIIGSEPTAYAGEKNLVISAARVHRMDAETPENLNRFLSFYDGIGAVFLTPAFAPPDWNRSQMPEIGMDLRILIRHIHVRNAWEIGLNDIDASGIREGDNPIIPEGVLEPPVLKLLRQ